MYYFFKLVRESWNFYEKFEIYPIEKAYMGMSINYILWYRYFCLISSSFNSKILTRTVELKKSRRLFIDDVTDDAKECKVKLMQGGVLHCYCVFTT